MSSGRSTWVEVSGPGLEANLRSVAAHAGVPVCAVVKANAYGHGLVPAARTFARGGAAMLGVTRIEEARALRDAGIDTPVLVMLPCADAHAAAALGCDLVVGSADEVAGLPSGARVHLEIDTGMGRSGVPAEEAFAVAGAIAGRATLDAVWTHFAAAARTGRRQLERFTAVLDALRRHGVEARAHASNSAALIALPGARFDMVRVGTLLYGQDPPGARAPWAHHDTFAWYARVVTVRALSEGATVGYGSEWRARRATRVATIPIGFADGFGVEPATRTRSARQVARGAVRLLRRGGREVLFGERSAPVVGRIGMQALTVALDGLPEVGVGSVARIPARRLTVSADVQRVYTGEP